jgi:Flp pilus assembly protein TadB
MLILRGLVLLSVTAGALLVAASWRRAQLRRLALERLTARGGEFVAGRGRATTAWHTLWFWPPLLGSSLALLCYFALGFPIALAAASGVIVGLLGRQLQLAIIALRTSKLENQLADALDIMVGALGAGAGATAALRAAADESRGPLRPYLEDVIGRIRLGDAPAEVFRALSQRVRLETFLLFSSALAVHWEVGGSLAPILATVGHAVRERIETERRIRANVMQSNISTALVLGLTYFIALILWRNSPEHMAEFLSTSIGSFFVATSMVLQALGIVWMARISKPRF